MRTVVPIAAFLLLSLNVGPLRAASDDNTLPDQQTLEALEARASQAEPREQCFLYSAARAADDRVEHSPICRPAMSPRPPACSSTFRASRKKIHLTVTDNDKRLKNAELMLSHTAFRLSEMLQASSVDDRPLFQQTLAQVTDAQNATMMQVFRSK